VTLARRQIPILRQVRSRVRPGSALCALLMLAACGHAPPERSELRETAVRWDQRAHAAYRAGDYDGARADFQRALDIYRSLEDAEGIGTELVNLSTIHLAAGDTDSAMRVLAPMLENPGIGFAPGQQAEAAYRLAFIRERRRESKEAEQMAAQAQALCRQANCASAGAILNLRATLAQARGERVMAADLAQQALQAARQHADRIEQANASRLLGDLRLAQGAHPEAEKHYREALELDRAAEVPKKIALDLLGIGQSLRAQGRLEQALGYFQRAHSVADSIGDRATAESAQAAIRELEPATGQRRP
jgi:tetratricopeptide (TPR) repeat protein